MMNDIEIRTVSPNDAEEILSIYAEYVKNTAITFEYEVPSVEEFRGRIENTLKMYPYIKAVNNGKIIGYAYAGVFKGRAAYDWSVEVTIYVYINSHGLGCGKKLYNELERLLNKQGIQNVNACIAYTEHEDEYLTKNSPEFHEHMGYRTVGKFNKCAYKFGRWYDMIWMEKMLGSHEEKPQAVKTFEEINDLL